MKIRDVDVIDRLPDELAAALSADEYFCDIPVVVWEKGNIVEMRQSLQAVITAKGGRRGVAVIVLQVEADDEYPEQSFGPLLLKPSFQVIEAVELNKMPGKGTGKSARQVARQIINVIKPLALPGLVSELNTDNPCIHPVQPDKAVGENVVMYQVNFKCYEVDDDAPREQVAPPDIEQDGDNFAITCETPDAEIYYSTDDSFPSPQNLNASADGTGSLVYTDPIAIPVTGVTVRARAYAKGMIASWVEREKLLIN